MPNFRRNARGRPQILQRLCLRVENFGFGPLPRASSNFFSIFASFTLFAVVKFAPKTSCRLSAVSSQSNPRIRTFNYPIT